MNSKLNASERRHLAKVKSLDCSCCGAIGPTSAHHIEQGQTFTCIPLCYDCHQGPQGIHGDKTLWRVMKTDELKCLNWCLEKLLGT
jgi:hypothetical protein